MTMSYHTNIAKCFVAASTISFAVAAHAEAPAPTDPAADPVVVASAAPEAVTPKAEWTPLDGKQFGKELGAAFIPVPNGSSGAPRQGWLATADGFFTREAHIAYANTDTRGATGQQVLARFNHPLSRRLWAGVEVPFYEKNGNQDGFGDVTLATKLLLVETRNVSLNAGVAWRLPTGAARNGNGVFAAQPQLNLYTDVGHGFSLRGAVGYAFAGSARATDSFVLNAAIGQTVTPHSKAPFGDLTWYVAANWNKPTRGADFFSITPGVRTHLGGNLFLLGGVELPVTNTANSFRHRFIIQFVQGF